MCSLALVQTMVHTAVKITKSKWQLLFVVDAWYAQKHLYLFGMLRKSCSSPANSLYTPIYCSVIGSSNMSVLCGKHLSSCGITNSVLWFGCPCPSLCMNPAHTFAQALFQTLAQTLPEICPNPYPSPCLNPTQTLSQIEISMLKSDHPIRDSILPLISAL